jgi:archaellum biogenesis ATPase FlaH
MTEGKNREDLFMKVNDIKPAKWIIEGMVIEQGLTILFGDKGAGKTTLSMQILHALLSEEMLFGLKVRKENAFLVEQDESPMVFRNHRDRILGELPSLGDMEIPGVFVTWNSKKEDLTNLVDLIRAYPAKLVIIDSFTSLGIPDLNQPGTSAILDRLRQISTGADCSFILLHHVNRKGDILGSVTLQIKADNLVELNSNGLIFHKTRGEIGIPLGKENTLPIVRNNGSILFKLPMTQRAKMLLGNQDAPTILQAEYPKSTTGSIRATLAQAKRGAKVLVESIDFSRN